jgi:hypothetical protein
MSATLTGYAPHIVRATGCAPEDAFAVEELMRLEEPTLDHLPLLSFNELARAAYEALGVLRAEGHTI